MRVPFVNNTHKKSYRRGMSERRTRLKELTATAHARLDSHVDQAGFFVSQSGYRQYLRATWRARAALEPLLDRSGATALFPLWPERRLRSLLQLDLEDVGESAGDAGQADGEPLATGAVLGTLYVLEGSALGARLIERRVAQIGMTATFGARHLGCQTMRSGAWAQFLGVLEVTPLAHEAEDDCVRSALATFARFEHEYGAAG